MEHAFNCLDHMLGAVKPGTRPTTQKALLTGSLCLCREGGGEGGSAEGERVQVPVLRQRAAPCGGLPGHPGPAPAPGSANGLHRQCAHAPGRHHRL